METDAVAAESSAAAVAAAAAAAAATGPRVVLRGWCSWCWQYTEHEMVLGAKGQRSHYRCMGCRSTTAVCASGCHAMSKATDVLCSFCQGAFRSWEEAEELVSSEPRHEPGAAQEKRPVWQPDRAASHCVKCECSFALITARHHCRACGKVVCASCSRKRADLSSLSPFYKTPVRICDFCAPLPLS